MPKHPAEGRLRCHTHCGNGGMLYSSRSCFTQFGKSLSRLFSAPIELVLVEPCTHLVTRNEPITHLLLRQRIKLDFLIGVLYGLMETTNYHLFQYPVEKRT